MFGGALVDGCTGMAAKFLDFLKFYLILPWKVRVVCPLCTLALLGRQGGQGLTIPFVPDAYCLSNADFTFNGRGALPQMQNILMNNDE